jgi:hypothetical protein
MDMDCAVTDGGNRNLVNGDEALTRAECVSDMAIVVVPGGADDFSHVNPVFRESQ